MTFIELTEDRELILGGVKIPYEKGLLGLDSDADVLLHAIMDALLGASCAWRYRKDIFPDTDPAVQKESQYPASGTCRRTAG